MFNDFAPGLCTLIIRAKVMIKRAENGGSQVPNSLKTPGENSF